jgi:hypothetical protein
MISFRVETGWIRSSRFRHILAGSGDKKPPFPVARADRKVVAEGLAFEHG